MVRGGAALSTHGGYRFGDWPAGEPGEGWLFEIGGTS
jgi:hypothetical protein